MSYARMDHAGWLAEQLRRPVVGFEANVADIVGMTWGGIYNAPINWKPSKGAPPGTARGWEPIGSPARGVIVTVGCGGRLATWDFNLLGQLVFLCHAARVRGEITARTRGYFRIMFTRRTHAGEIWTRHPNLDEAVTAFREYLPADHRIIYRLAHTEAAE